MEVRAESIDKLLSELDKEDKKRQSSYDATDDQRTAEDDVAITKAIHEVESELKGKKQYAEEDDKIRTLIIAIIVASIALLLVKSFGIPSLGIPPTNQ